MNITRALILEALHELPTPAHHSEVHRYLSSKVSCSPTPKQVYQALYRAAQTGGVTASRRGYYCLISSDAARAKYAQAERNRLHNELRLLLQQAEDMSAQIEALQAADQHLVEQIEALQVERQEIHNSTKEASQNLHSTLLQIKGLQQ